MRPTFERLNEALLAVSPAVFADLTTVYIKYCVDDSPLAAVYSVVWVKTARQLVTGLALPDGYSDPALLAPPKRMTYKGLTKYFLVKPGDSLPASVAEMACLAHETVSQRAGGNAS